MQRLTPEQRQKVFDRICEIAIDGNRRQLRELLAKHNITIAFTVSNCTPICHLAIHGLHEAVNFLMERFNASPYEALLGYGRANHAPAAQALIATGLSDKTFVMGLAQAGYIEAILNLGDKLQDNTYRSYILRGLAMGGHVELIGRLPFATIFHQQHSYIYGLAYSGRTEELNKELELGARKSKAIWGYAAAGREKDVEELLGQLNQQDIFTYLPALIHAASGYATSGYVELVEGLASRGNITNISAYGFAVAGIKYKVEELPVTKHTIEEAMRGYLESHAIKEAVSLLPPESGNNNDISTIEHLIKTCTSVCHNEDNLDFFLNICSHIPDSHQRIIMAYRRSAPENAWKTIPTAYRLNTLMQTYHLDFHAAKRALKINAQPGIKTWLLQGQQICMDRVQDLPVLPFDIYLRVTALVIGLPIEDVKKVFAMVNDFLLITVVNNKSHYHSVSSAIVSFFGGYSFEQNAGIRHQERIYEYMG